MKGFKFKLERLARVRKVQEELARAKWQGAVLEAQEAQERCELAREGIASAICDLRDIQSSSQIDARRVLHAREAISFLEERRDTLLRLADSAFKAAELLREPWQAVRTELEGLKRLEEKERTKCRINNEREEIKEIDEQAMDRARKNKLNQRRRSA
ncbi:MAG: flagellar export protein FliJ [Candidatus Paceibacteria bacterium]|jgi:flagellar export protein FliJ